MDDRYDEFGNYLGSGESEVEEAAMVLVDRSGDRLHDDRVQVSFQDRDQQRLDEPIIAPPPKIKAVDKIPETRYKKEFLIDLTAIPDRIRNLVVGGSIHHGKTLFVDLLVSDTHCVPWSPEHPFRYTDTLWIERERGISIKCSAVTLAMQNTKGKSHVINCLDTPGHVGFMDETICAFHLADGLVLVVDVVEGIMYQTKMLIRHAVLFQLPIVLVLNKIDRLILELRLPPSDAYFKLKHIIDEINTIISSLGSTVFVAPEQGNVCFASCSTGWIFTLESFSAIYCRHHGLDRVELARRLWGNVYYDRETFRFREGSHSKRTFVEFVLEPIYKIYSHVVGEDEAALKTLMDGLKIELTKSQYALDTKVLLRVICGQFFGTLDWIVDALVQHIPPPSKCGAIKADQLYLGPRQGSLWDSLASCDPYGPLLIHVTKLYPAEDSGRFDCFGRIMSGTIRNGQNVCVVGQKTDRMVVNGLWIAESRYRLAVESMGAGNWVLIGGIDAQIFKTGVVVEETIDWPAGFKELWYPTRAVISVGIEPMDPKDHFKMIEGLRGIGKSYPLLQTRVEESGEHVVLGPDELYLDCALHDLRKVFSQIDIRVSDPSVVFGETVMDLSSVPSFSTSLNGKNTLTFLAEPLEKGASSDLEHGLGSPQLFVEKYGWDELASQSIWAFAPDDTKGPNVLLNDTFPTNVDQTRLQAIRDQICQGFKWGMREGPLCEEPIRDVKFRIIDAVVSGEAVYRGGGQIIPATRKAVHSALLTACPRLVEPVFQVEIQGLGDVVSIIYTLVAKRRGHVIQDEAKPGSPFYVIKALIPTIDSFGFETDLRMHTRGLAFCQSIFDHWQIVPGDPLDDGGTLQPLESSSIPYLARDFMVKTRRRKGLSDKLNIHEFLDRDMWAELSRHLSDQS